MPIPPGLAWVMIAPPSSDGFVRQSISLYLRVPSNVALAFRAPYCVAARIAPSWNNLRPQLASKDLSARRLRQLVDELDRTWILVSRHPLPAVCNELRLG